MSLRKCHECGHDVSSSAMKCPNCGADVQTTSSKIMVLVIFLIGAIICAVFIYRAWYNSDMQVFKRAGQNMQEFQRDFNKGFR